MRRKANGIKEREQKWKDKKLIRKSKEVMRVLLRRR